MGGLTLTDLLFILVVCNIQQFVFILGCELFLISELTPESHSKLKGGILHPIQQARSYWDTLQPLPFVRVKPT